MGWKQLCANNFKNQNHETKEKKGKDNDTTISLQKYFSDSHSLPFSNVYYVFNEFKWVNKEKKKRKDESFRQVVA